MKNRKNKKGFTIVELVIVIGVIGILSAILIPTFVNLTNKANAAREQQEVRNAYVAYQIDAEDGYLYNETGKAQSDWVAVNDVKGIDKVAVLRGEDYFVYDTAKGEWKNEGKTYTPGDLIGKNTDDSFKYNGCFIYNRAVA